MFTSIVAIKRANKSLGHYFFSADTLRFFASTVCPKVYSGNVFITSEKACFDDNTRVYAVRRANDDGSIETLVRDLPSLYRAVEKAKSLAETF